MIDLSSIEKYIDEPDSFMISFIQHQIKSVGLESFLEHNFHSLDCSRIMNNNLRPMQTIGYPYRRTITETIFIIENYIEKSKQDEYFERLLKRHNDNVEYEQLNPPVWYCTDKERLEYERKYSRKTNTNRKRKNATNNDDSDKQNSRKQTAAERKLAAKVAKINNLSFKIKLHD